jgi:pimeloyl-ACP methyl ester carboxylesterase
MSFHIAGCSLGGDVAVVMAALYPERVRSIAAWSMSMGPPMSVDGLRARDAAGFYKGFDENEVALPQTIDDVAPGWFIDRERIHEQNASRKMAGPWMKPVSRGISRCNFPAYMPRVKCPMVITYGEQRHFGEFAEEVLAKVKGSRQVTLPGAVSFMHEDQPRMLVDMIADHFAAADKALS